MPKNKYQKQIRQYSVDGGLTWNNVVPEESRRGRLIEEASPDCNPIEWREVTGAWFCVEFDEEYRWVQSSSYECHIGDKYTEEKEQVTYDGTTWTDTGRTRAGETIRNSQDCPIVYEDEALTLEIMSDTATIYSNIDSLEYKIDNGDWQQYNGGIEATLGQKIQWRGHLTETNGNVFRSTGDIRVFGNINSVYDYDNFTTNCYDYFQFFYENDDVIDAEHLILPATTLTQEAYKCMFTDAVKLVTPPALPATTLAIDCYSQMFKGCSSLTSAPQLPAMTMQEGCYYQMFAGCTSLVTPPALPATTLADGCYYQMFFSCTNLTSCPSLPAMSVPVDAYNGMFKNCINLVSAPQLPATTLSNFCYSEMFYHCLSLTTAPSILPATTLAEYCYNWMFKETAITTAPVLPATTFENADCWDGVTRYCYYEMFRGCSNLTYIKMMLVDTPIGQSQSAWALRSFTADWVRGVAASGTFVKNGGAMWNEVGVDGVPSGWTIQYDGSGTRWVTVSGQYVCVGNDKYTMEKEQVTTDGGTTWIDTGDTRAGTLIEASSQDCMYATEYFTITSLADNNNIYWNNAAPSQSGYARGIYISTDNGTTWTSKLSQRNQISIATLNTGDKLLVKATQTSYYNSYRNYFSSDNSVDLSGNIMSLLYGDNFVGQTELTANYTFRGMFAGLEVVNAQNLVLPATTLSQGCYYQLFQNCFSLVTIPTLPATGLAVECYAYMFDGCDSLATAPQLPATTLANYCYANMMSGTAITTSPTLAAPTLAASCYYRMFYHCYNLVSVTCLATDISASNCTNGWLVDVGDNGTFTKASSMTDWTEGNSGIPSGWTVVDA